MTGLASIERRAVRMTAALVILILAAIIMRAVANPMRARQADLDSRLAQIQPIPVAFEKAQYPAEQWQQAIINKPALWNPIIQAPAGPAPTPEAPPDLKSLLADVIPTRQQVGAKAKIITSRDPKGSFMAVGEQISNAVIKEITRTSVTFALDWHGQELTLSLPRK